ncbi:glycoside hydrolase family 16 protein [Punctularia strigosozonata HHB-11173 SS5]|uniref:glycoside hydrolase family 16 protein n=1 Tax=Punctularia strigosozonata (strain HHB-11173) TaxID=741275 RepID=UPI00044163AE|nr:glycoside hydrolase family 16 protein [Punctularia strigosozonata HHB-11173 SS5]EIN09399.1 glycoside hydrolase family 16 protein [Punctularia strigosozonata HHB-11173 SS5]
MFKSLFIATLVYIAYAASVPSARGSGCTPFHTVFTSSEVSASDSAPFVAISPQGSFSAGEEGLRLFLDRPTGKISTTDGINDKVADGATINSTFTLLHGKVTFELAAPSIPGVVTAVILIADPAHDEIDIELLGGDASNFQTNIFVPQPEDHNDELYGVFSSVQSVASDGGSSTIEEMHSYAVDWTAEQIVWSVDGKDVMTINRDDTQKNGVLHFPSHPARIQLGIWDASNPIGTSEWGKGPIAWDVVPGRIAAVVKSIRVEC